MRPADRSSMKPAMFRLPQLTSGQPYLTYEKEGSVRRIDCDYVAGCDGYHGVSRSSIPSSVLRTYEKGYPFGWLGIMSETPPFPDLCYCYHRRGVCACVHAQPNAQPLLYPVRPRYQAGGLAGPTLLAGIQDAMSKGDGRPDCHRAID